jgi:hypothetical protein
MVVCLATPVMAVLEELTRAQNGAYLWRGSYFLVFVFFASLEGTLSERVLQERRVTGWTYLVSRGSEALLLLLVLKLVNYIPLGFEQLRIEALIWPTNPYAFVQPRDLLSGMLFLPLWAGAIRVARIMRDLDLDENEKSPPQDKTSPAYYLWLTQPPVARYRQAAVEELVNAALWGGLIILVVSTALYLLSPGARVAALSTLAYFALAVTLLIQARFSVSHAGWRLQGVSIQPGIGRRWLLWSVIFLIGVALFALILPTRFSMGPLTALLGLLGILYSVLMFFINLLLYLLFLPIAWLFPKVEPRPFPSDQIPIPPETPAVGAATTPWLEILASGFFWLLVLAIVGYAVRRFWQDRVATWSETEEFRTSWWGRLLTWLRASWQALWRWGGELPGRVARRLAHTRMLGELPPRPSRFLFPGRLPPRELVRYFYLSMSRRAAQAGRLREPGQTPHEYQAALDQQFPELEPDLTGLTSAFVKARYSRQSVEKEDVAAVKPLWQRIKAILQRRRRTL